jgi:hypothetical protein
MNAPVIGAEAGYAGEKSWSAAFSWRYQKSDRHFRGSEEESIRQAENSEVITWANMLELSLTRNFTDRWSVSVGIPYFLMERSNAIRDPSITDTQFGDPDGPVVTRTETEARGIGDITVVPHFWAFKPETHPNYNLSLGFGVKLPTGDASVEDTFQVRVDTPGITTESFMLTNVVRTVDQSIQPGDGGFGVVLDLQGFYRFARNRGAGYLTATYLANPENTNGVATYRNLTGTTGPQLVTVQDANGNDIQVVVNTTPVSSALEGVPGSEAYMSVADQYLYRIGATWFPTGKIGLSLGGRWEGVPVNDLVGQSDGFRRPGYAFSIEPGFSYSTGPHSFSLLVPIAEHRNRLRNNPDRETANRHGDAAFADWVVIAGYFRRF